MPRPIITLTTDFGVQDHYVGAMKGVILSRCPDANVIDISHEIAPQAVAQGAYVLAAAAAHFPPHAIHLAVVDPGVGSDRRPIALSTPAGLFVAPDNGILTRVLAALGAEAVPDAAPNRAADAPASAQVPDGCRAVVLDDPSYWLPQVSHTFHGRDIFAPVAGALARGVELSQVGSATNTINVLPTPSLQEGAGIRGAIIHIDRYGNLITDIPAAGLSADARICIAGHHIEGISRSYSERPGKLLAISGSQGTLEVAVGNGNAAAALGANVGDIALVTARCGTDAQPRHPLRPVSVDP